MPDPSAISNKTSIYARVSSEDQAERGTIENQIEFATKYCDLHKLDIVEWYKDDGITGTIPLEMREAGSRLLEDAKNHKFELLLIYRLDRLGRSARIILNAVYELEQHGIKIRSMTEPFDTGDPNGRFLLTVLAGVADLERETILERMWHGANRAARDGKWLGGIVPYGYRVNEAKKLEINEDMLPGFEMSEADVISLIYRLITEQKLSTIKVSDYLNALGLPPSYTKDGRQVKQGKRKVNTAGIWRPGRISTIVRNTTYKGIHYYGKKSSKQRDLIPREVPAIVSEETWDKARLMMHDNQLEAMKNSKTQYLLRGLIKCGICGLTYHGINYESSKKGKAYYKCGGKTSYHGPLEGKCSSKNVPQQWIEEIIWGDCVKFIMNPGNTLDELAATMEQKKSQKASLESERDMVLKAIRDKEPEKQSILDLYRKNIINAKDVEIQLLNISREIGALEERAKELELQIKDENNLANHYDTAEQLLKDLQGKLESEPSFETRREIVRTLVKEVKIETKPGANGRPRAVVNAQYTFVKVVLYTDKRAENNIDYYPLERSNNMPAWFLGHNWTGDTSGSRIRQARVAKVMTITDLATAAGMATATISDLEADKKSPAFLTLRKLSQVLEVPIAFLGCFEGMPEESLGQRITKARHYHGLMITEMAQAIGVNAKTLRHWEKSEQNPSQLYLTILEQYLAILSGN